MRKSCLIVVVAVPIFLLLAGGVALYQLNHRFGIFAAPAISHEEFAGTDTRLRAVLSPRALSNFIAEVVPKNVELPKWIPFSRENTFKEMLPNEVALLGGADYRSGKYLLTLFVNERRGGPLIAQLINQSGSIQNSQGMEWDPAGLVFEKRGVLSLRGALPLPEQMEDVMLEHWTHQPPAQPLKIEGSHLFELTLDNRNGDALTLWGAMLQMNGQDFQAQVQNEQTQKIVALIPEIYTLRLQGDLSDPETLRIRLRLEASDAVGPNLQAMLGLFVIAPLQVELRNRYAVTLAGDAKWNAAEKALIGEYHLTEWKKQLLEAIQKSSAAPPPAS